MMLVGVVKNGISEYVPEMKPYHMHVSGTAATDDLTPPTGKRIVIYGISDYDISVTSATNSTAEATLSFGTGNGSDHNKVLSTARKDDTGDTVGGAMSHINIIGEVNEIVRLTNMTFTTGTATVRINVYYQFI